MARGYNMDVSFPDERNFGVKEHRQKKTIKNTVRRRIDIPLGERGAEIRLPSIPVVHLSKRWLWLLVAICLAGGIYFIWYAPFFTVDRAQVSGLRQIKTADVNAVLDVSGKPIFMVRPYKLEQALQAAFPEFNSITVSVKLPNSVNVLVSERKPVLTWRQGESIQLIDQDGYAFPLRLGSSTVITPVVDAAGGPPAPGLTVKDISAWIARSAAENGQGQDGLAENLIAAQEESSAELPLMKPEMVSAILTMGTFLSNDAPLIYDPDHGLGWVDERGWEVYLGDAEDMEMKLHVYDAIVQKLLDEEIQPELISVEHVHSPYFRADIHKDSE